MREGPRPRMFSEMGWPKMYQRPKRSAANAYLCSARTILAGANRLLLLMAAGR